MENDNKGTRKYTLTFVRCTRKCTLHSKSQRSPCKVGMAWVNRAKEGKARGLESAARGRALGDAMRPRGRVSAQSSLLLLRWSLCTKRTSESADKWINEFFREVLVSIFKCLQRTEEEQVASNTREKISGLPWWRSGWESACQCRGHGFEPWSGRIPHAAEQLGPCATTTEPARLEPVLRNRRGRDSERPAHRDEEWPPLATTGESPRTETETQHSQK